MLNRPPNSHECGYFGRKLSNVSTDSIKTSLNEGELYVGTECDDEIYFGECLGENEEMLKERVKIYIEHYPDDYHLSQIEIDLEDLLRWSRKHCSGIYERVFNEVET